jgi:hypothetical protein
VAAFDQDDLPGFYEMRQEPGTPPVVVAVNVEPRESDVRMLTSDSLAAALAGLPARILPGGENVVATIRETRVGRELWRVLMAIALAVLALEALLAWKFSRQMDVAESASEVRS